MSSRFGPGSSFQVPSSTCLVTRTRNSEPGTRNLEPRTPVPVCCLRRFSTVVALPGVPPARPAVHPTPRAGPGRSSRERRLRRHSHSRGTIMSESEQTYDEGRARNLEALLRALAARISELDSEGKLLAQAGELMKLIGDVRSELFHYEVRATYDTPEVAENRRIVSEALTQQETTWEKTDWTRDEEDESEW